MEQKNKKLTDFFGSFDSLLPPKEAYLLFPQQNEEFVGKEKKILRWYFEGQVNYTEFEKLRIVKFTNYLQEKKKTEIISGWGEPDVLRWIEGNAYKNEKIYKSIKEQNIWREQIQKIIFDDDIQKFIQQGILYISGRDIRFRPIIVMNVHKMDIKIMKVDIMLKGIDFILQLAINNMMLPGQIENWVIIIDFNNLSIKDVPLSPFKTIIQYLTGHYKSRLYRLYSVNTPSAITMPWKAVKIFLEDQTVEKINFIKASIPAKLFDHANPYQVEKRFGGKMQDKTLEQQWPPQMDNVNIFHANDNVTKLLINPDQYRKMVKDGVLQKNKVCQQLLAENAQVDFNQIESLITKLREELKLEEGASNKIQVEDNELNLGGNEDKDKQPDNSKDSDDEETNQKEEKKSDDNQKSPIKNK